MGVSSPWYGWVLEVELEIIGGAKEAARRQRIGQPLCCSCLVRCSRGSWIADLGRFERMIRKRKRAGFDPAGRVTDGGWMTGRRKRRIKVGKGGSTSSVLTSAHVHRMLLVRCVLVL